MTYAVVSQVTLEDLGRVAAATGAKVQSTVNKLDTKVLGSCGTFQEKQVCVCFKHQTQ